MLQILSLISIQLFTSQYDDELLNFDWLSEWSKNRHPFRAFSFVESIVNRIDRTEYWHRQVTKEKHRYLSDLIRPG